MPAAPGETGFFLGIEVVEPGNPSAPGYSILNRVIFGDSTPVDLGSPVTLQPVAKIIATSYEMAGQALRVHLKNQGAAAGTMLSYLGDDGFSFSSQSVDEAICLPSAAARRSPA